MTSAAATVNVTYNSTDVTDIDGIFLQQVVQGGPGTLPNVSGEDDLVPGAEGVFVRNRIGRTRSIELRGWVRGIATTEASDRDDYWANRAALETLMARTATASLVVDTGGVSYTITARPDSIVYDEQLPSFAYVSVVLISTVPDWT